MVRKCRCVFEAFGGTKQGVEKTSLTYSVNNHTAVKHEPASKIPLDSLQHTVQEYGQKMFNLQIYSIEFLNEVSYSAKTLKSTNWATIPGIVSSNFCCFFFPLMHNDLWPPRITTDYTE